MTQTIQVQCPPSSCDRAKQFPVGVTLSNNDSAVESIQVTCPYCDQKLTLELNRKVISNKIIPIRRG